MYICICEIIFMCSVNIRYYDLLILFKTENPILDLDLDFS